MHQTLIDELRLALKIQADEATRQSASRFFKEDQQVLIYGLKSADASKLASGFCKQVKSFSKQEVFAICEELWKSHYLEEAIIACKCSEALSKQMEPRDFAVFEQWVTTYVTNWATCDTLCNHTVGDFIMKYPDNIEQLKKWATSSNRWTKRAAAVTLIIPARKGLFLNDVFAIADILLLDSDDMVQKGYGWMLKAASESYQTEVFNYVLSKKAVMPRTALRYAIEKMPKELKAEAMKK